MSTKASSTRSVERNLTAIGRYTFIPLSAYYCIVVHAVSLFLLPVIGDLRVAESARTRLITFGLINVFVDEVPEPDSLSYYLSNSAPIVVFGVTLWTNIWMRARARSKQLKSLAWFGIAAFVATTMYFGRTLPVGVWIGFALVSGAVVGHWFGSALRLKSGTRL